MKDIPRVQSSFRVWLVLALSVFLLCGLLTGCHNGRDDKGDTGKTESPLVEPSKNEQSPIEPPKSNEELLNDLVRDIEALSSASPEYSESVEALKNAARNMPELSVDPLFATSLDALIERIKNLQGVATHDIPPTWDDLEALRVKAETLKAQIEPLKDNDEIQGAIQATQDAIESMLSTSESNLQTGLTNVQNSVEGLRKSVSLTTFLSALFSAAGLISMVVAIVMIQQQKAMIQGQTRIIQSSNKKLEVSYHSPYKTSAYPGGYVPSGRDSEATGSRANATAGWSNPYGTLDEKMSQETAETSSTNQAALSGVSSAGTNGFAPTAPQPTLLTLKLDAKKQNPLKKDEVWLASTIPPSEFSGEATDVPDEYRIWPDPRNRGIQSQHSQEISRQNLYFGYVKACFDITPPSAGNYQSFVIQVETCATVRKSGNSYQLISKGKIRAQGST